MIRRRIVLAIPRLDALRLPTYLAACPRQVSTTKRNLVALLPWAHRTRLQQLLLLLLTANVSNKSGNLLFAQSYPEQYEKVGFVHSWCTESACFKAPAFSTRLQLIAHSDA